MPPRARTAAAATGDATPRRGGDGGDAVPDADVDAAAVGGGGDGGAGGGDIAAVLAAIQTAMATGFTAITSRMDIADERLLNLEQVRAGGADDGNARAGSADDGDGPDADDDAASAADARVTSEASIQCCSMPGCNAARIIEYFEKEGRRVVHPFCSMANAAAYRAREMPTAGSGPRSSVAGSAVSDAARDADVAGDSGPDEPDDARSRSSLLGGAPRGAWNGYAARHVVVSDHDGVYQYINAKLKSLVDAIRTPEERAMADDFLVANELLSEAEWMAMDVDPDTRARFPGFLDVLSRASNKLKLCIDTHVLHPLTTGSRAESLVLRRAVDPYGQEEALYCLPKSRELIHERLVKDADNSARKITEPERPYNRRGSRGGAKNDKEERKGDKARKGGNGGGGGGGNAARSGSQERGKPRGGAESAPRAEK